MALENPRRLVLDLRLPSELIDQIIDHLHDDIASLGTCSLVCKTWTRSARFHLFSKLLVHGRDAKRMLESVPPVIPFIRHLRLGKQPWDETLPLLVGLESIRSLSVYGLHTHRLGSQALSALFHNFSSAVDVRLDNVQFVTAVELIRFICAFPCLQALAIEWGSPRPEKFAVGLPIRLSPSPHLRALELDGFCLDEVLYWFLELPDHPTLRTVALHCLRSNNSENIARFLSALQYSLESLLVSTSIAHGRDWPFNLLRHTCLRSLQIELDDSTDARLVTQMLSQMSSPHIQEVRLEICTGDDDEIVQFGWSEIDAALQHSSFSGLRTVTVVVLQWPTLYGWDHNAVSWITDGMPGCRARDILHVYDMEWQSSFFSR